MHGLDGVDEISLVISTKETELNGGWTRTYRIDPGDYGYESCARADLGVAGFGLATFFESMVIVETLKRLYNAGRIVGLHLFRDARGRPALAPRRDFHSD